MPLKVMCKNLVDYYSTANMFEAITKSYAEAIAQIQNEPIILKPHPRVLDLGVGNGAFLEKLNAYMPQAAFTGIDICSDRLEHARKALSLTAIEGSALHASHLLPSHSQDLVLAHFINACIPIPTLFKQANLLTRANGYFSLITTTYESFPIAQQQLANFIAEDTLVSTVVGHYYKNIVGNATVAPGLEELLKAFKEHHFKIIQQKRLCIPIIIRNVDDLTRFGIEGTWFLNSSAVRMLPKNFLIQRLKRLFTKIFTFPYEDTHIIDIILAQK